MNFTPDHQINKVKRIVDSFEENLRVRKCNIGPYLTKIEDSEGAKSAVKNAFEVLMERGDTPLRTPGKKMSSYKRKKSGKVTSAEKNLKIDKWLEKKKS